MPIRPRARLQRSIAVALAPAFLAAACGGRTNEQPDPLPGDPLGGATAGGAPNLHGGAPMGARANGGRLATGGRAAGGAAVSGAPSGARAGSGGQSSGGGLGGGFAGALGAGGTIGGFAGSLGVGGAVGGGGFAGGGFAGRFTGGGVAGKTGGEVAGSFAGGGVAGARATGGEAGSCTDSQGAVPLAFRSCVIDSDCRTLTLGSCCSRDRVVGISASLVCTPPPLHCEAVDCVKAMGFVTDDGQVAASSSEISVRCQVVEPGITVCRTTLTSNTGGTIPCGNGVCDAGELCVHRSARGGPAPRCTDIPPNGVCPPDTMYQMSCNNNGPGCQELLLTPEPFCAPVPPGCGSPTACQCLPSDLCQSPQVCIGVMGRQVHCQDQSP
jgi:hypothetical protein